MAEFGKMGIGGFNYWYTNMYHFINQWDHLKNLKSAAPLHLHKMDLPQDYNNLDLPKSQEVVGRLISLGISTQWTVEQMTELAANMKTAIANSLS